MGFSWEAKAHAGQPCPGDITEIHEIMAYEAMSWLYRRFDAGDIDVQKATAEKSKIVNTYSAAAKRIQESEYVVNRKIKFFHDTEFAVEQFNKSETLEDKVEWAERFIEILYNNGSPISRSRQVAAHRDTTES